MSELISGGLPLLNFLKSSQKDMLNFLLLGDEEGASNIYFQARQISDCALSLNDFIGFFEEWVSYRHLLSSYPSYRMWGQFLSLIGLYNYTDWFTYVIKEFNDSPNAFKNADLFTFLYCFLGSLLIFDPILYQIIEDHDEAESKAIEFFNNINRLYSDSESNQTLICHTILNNVKMAIEFMGLKEIKDAILDKWENWCHQLTPQSQSDIFNLSVKSLNFLSLSYAKKYNSLTYNENGVEGVNVYFRLPDEFYSEILNKIDCDDTKWFKMEVPKFGIAYTHHVIKSRPGIWIKCFVSPSQIVYLTDAVSYCIHECMAIIRFNNPFILVNKQDVIVSLNNIDKAIVYSELLQKSQKMPALAKFGIALAMMGVPEHTDRSKSLVPAAPRKDLISQSIKMPRPLHTHFDEHLKALMSTNMLLRAIAQTESSGGYNVNHKIINYGMHKGTSAVGFWGMMPIVIHETIKQSPELSKQYGHLLSLHPIKDSKKLADAVLSDPDLHKGLAETHFNRLKRIFKNDHFRIAYAWNKGIAAAKRADADTVASDDYVQKVMFNYHLIKQKDHAQLQKDKLFLSKLNKSEELQLDAVYADHDEVFEWEPDTKKEFMSHKPLEIHGQYSFKLNPIVKQLNYDVQEDLDYINYCFNQGYIYSFNLKGLGTKYSFVVGDPEQESGWLIKIDDPSLPTDSLKSVSEYASYALIDKVFKMKNHVPPMILGDVVIQDENGVTIQYSAVAIKLLPPYAKVLSDLYSDNVKQFWRQMEHWLETGLLHKFAVVLFVLGDADAHGKNFLSDKDDLWMIDFGMSLGSETESMFDMGFKIAWMPYLLRVWQLHPDPDKRNPVIKKTSVKQELHNWLMNVDIQEGINILHMFHKYDYAKLLYDRWMALLNSEMWGIKTSIDESINNFWGKVSVKK